MKLTRRDFARTAAASAAALAMPPIVGRALGDMPKAEVGDRLVVYSGTGLQTTLVDKLIEPFADYMQKKYGVATEVQNVVGQAPTSWARFKTEWPNPSGDVYQFYNENIQEGIPQGYYLPLRQAYTDEEWARFDLEAMKAMGTGDYVAPVDISASVLVVQNSVTDPIDSWAVLGDEKFARRVTFDSALAVGSGYNMIQAAALTVGNDYKTWFKDGKFDENAALPAFQECARWAENALTMTQGSGSITPLLRRQEALVSAWWWHNGEDEVGRGTPVHIVYPKEGCPASVNCGEVVSAKTANPVAALEWVKFFHSDVADELAVSIHEYNRIPKVGETPNEHWAAFIKASKIAWANEFRSLTIGAQYNQQVLDLYNRVVIQGG
jgi:ABC-type Fe3+ transport system substrate-binding protein